MNQAIQNNPGSTGVGSTSPQAHHSSTSSGDAALLKAMLMQLLELDTLTNAATSESSLSVALRTSMQGKMTDRVEEYQKLLDFCSSCEGTDAYKALYNLIKSGNCTFNQLKAAYPNAPGLADVPPDCQDDFMSELHTLVMQSPDPSHADEFRTNVGTVGTMLSQYGTYLTACKNLADSFQNGAGSLTQSITQFLAQLATEGGLMTDVVAQ
ncbi:MAG: hypothetical protein S4CHLAM7_04990 [Chlamydiae bacterium]|nr:hypothetical protein [Chlamydiota bacterium]